MLQERQAHRALELTGAEQEELARLRVPPTDRELAPEYGIWLRTCYSPESDAAFALLESDLTRFEPALVLDDASQYNFGEDWQRIFQRMPQLVHNGVSAQTYSENKQAALQEALDGEEEDRAQAAESGYDPDEDATPWGDLSEEYQWTCVTGYLLIVDEATLSSGDGPEYGSLDFGTILAVWYDDRGREVRWTREQLGNVVQKSGLLMEPFIHQHAVWMNGSVGEDYERDAVLGTAYDTA